MPEKNHTTLIEEVKKYRELREKEKIIYDKNKDEGREYAGLVMNSSPIVNHPALHRALPKDHRFTYAGLTGWYFKDENNRINRIQLRGDVDTPTLTKIIDSLDKKYSLSKEWIEPNEQRRHIVHWRYYNNGDKISVEASQGIDGESKIISLNLDYLNKSKAEAEDKWASKKKAAEESEKSKAQLELQNF